MTRYEYLFGAAAIWTGVLYLFEAFVVGGFAPMLEELLWLAVAGGFFVIGANFLTGKRKRPADTGERLVPPPWRWYGFGAALVVVAVLRTVQLFVR